MKTIASKYNTNNLSFSKISKNTDILIWDSLFKNILADKDILKTMANHGYNNKKIEQGIVLLRNLIENEELLKVSKRRSLTAADALYTAKDNLDSIYTNHIKLFRNRFKKEPQLIKAFRAKGKLEVKFVYWLGDVRLFYLKLIGEVKILDELLNFGMHKSDFDTAIQLINEIEQLEKLIKEIEADEKLSFQMIKKSEKAFSVWVDKFNIVACSLFDNNNSFNFHLN